MIAFRFRHILRAEKTPLRWFADGKAIDPGGQGLVEFQQSRKRKRKLFFAPVQDVLEGSTLQSSSQCVVTIGRLTPKMAR